MAEAKNTLKDNWPIWACLFVVVVFSLVVRIKLLDVPLERDEGEYAYAGQLILRGIPPYARVYNMKMPGIYSAYAVILKLFGQSCGGIHLALLVINLATAFLLLMLGKRLFGSAAGAVTAACFLVLSVGQSVQGIFANAEHFVILTAVAGLLLLLIAIDSKKVWLLVISGLLLGIAFLMKQHGAAFIVFAAVYLLYSQLRSRPWSLKRLAGRFILFAAAIAFPLVITCLILWQAGVLKEFWFWTFSYAGHYVSAVPFSQGMLVLRSKLGQISASAVLIWVLAGVGVLGFLRNRRIRKQMIFALGFLVFSFLATCPGFYFRPHYFILVLPAVALFAGIGFVFLSDMFLNTRLGFAKRIVPTALIVIVLLYSVYQQRDLFFKMDAAQASRSTYGYNPFPESVEIGRFISENSSEGDSIAVIGSEPQIYFYSKRISASGHIYTYALMENHPFALKMQNEMIEEIEKAEPKFLVFVNIQMSWLVRPDSKRRIFQWFNDYKQKYYKPVGLVDIVSMEKTIYRWGAECVDYQPRSSYWLFVLQRNN